MAPDWKRLADYITAAMEERDWTQERLADAAGVAPRTVRDLISGRDRSRWPTRTLRRVERAFGWPVGTARRILEEGAVPPGHDEDQGGEEPASGFQLRDDNERIIWEEFAQIGWSPERIQRVIVAWRIQGELDQTGD